jgi:Tfp pilus assembly protein PilO
MAEKNTSTIILFVITGAIIVLFGVLGLLKFKSGQKIKADIKTTQDEINRLKMQATEKASLEQRIEEAMHAVDQLTKILPNKEEVREAEFMRLLKSFEESSGVTVLSLSPQQQQLPGEETGSGYSQHKYVVKLKGSFPQFVKFLHSLETHIRFFKVDSFDLQAPTEESEYEEETYTPKRLSIKVTISTYTYE